MYRVAAHGVAFAVRVYDDVGLFYSSSRHCEVRSNLISHSVALQEYLLRSLLALPFFLLAAKERNKEKLQSIDDIRMLCVSPMLQEYYCAAKLLALIAFSFFYAAAHDGAIERFLYS